ncbi:MAG: type I-E CRISPR-associated protein Cas6/Cse3/CasE [Candidatus Cloacimonetes bacterium HGW-Cloacimonetes-2]|nr:MAG: type I-E CRISPR-associated protein Cas6/Cse3/CasE [Candidatus Cloacimonetes bacterium HGW-Cloacimonetes-2]
MYLSQLLVDTGGNPDRPRPGRMWIGNAYNIHRRLSMAFPRYETLLNDPDSLKPFNPAMLEDRPFLFRLDNNVSDDGQRAIIIVQSSLKPNWDWCFHNAPDFLAAPPQMKNYDPDYQSGETLRYRIKLNPTIKSSSQKSINAITGEAGKNSKRLALTWDKDSDPETAINIWFAKKAESSGFKLIQSKLIQLSWVYGSKMKAADEQNEAGKVQHHKMKFRSALLEGILEVTDPSSFNRCICDGIGSAKSMGFGLLTVLRL